MKGDWILWEIAKESGFRIMPEDILDTWRLDQLKEYMAYRRICLMDADELTKM